jgi:hypothetical protein
LAVVIPEHKVIRWRRIPVLIRFVSQYLQSEAQIRPLRKHTGRPENTKMDQQIRNWVFRSLACFVVGIHQLPSGLWGTPDLYQAMWRVDGHQEQLNGVAFSKHVHRPTDWLTVGLGNWSHVTNRPGLRAD